MGRLGTHIPPIPTRRAEPRPGDWRGEPDSCDSGLEGLYHLLMERERGRGRERERGKEREQEREREREGKRERERGKVTCKTFK